MRREDHDRTLAGLDVLDGDRGAARHVVDERVEVGHERGLDDLDSRMRRANVYPELLGTPRRPLWTRTASEDVGTMRLQPSSMSSLNATSMKGCQ